MLVKGYALNELKRPAEAAQVLKTLVGHAPNNANYLTEYAYTVRVTGGELAVALSIFISARRILRQRLQTGERSALASSSTARARVCSLGTTTLG